MRLNIVIRVIPIDFRRPPVTDALNIITAMNYYFYTGKHYIIMCIVLGRVLCNNQQHYIIILNNDR